MYPLDQGRWGPTVRISHLRDELATLVDLDVVGGYRGARRVALARYALSGRLRRLDGIYVESSTFLPAETDVAFLGLARALGIPVLTYIRDAYQLFADYGRPSTLRGGAARAAFRPMIAALRAVSTRLAFPTAGLAHAVAGDDADTVLLPPGAPAPVEVPSNSGANRLLFVGDARLPAQGGDRLIEAARRARGHGVDVELEIVARAGQEPPAPHPEWLHLRRAEGPEIHALLPAVVGTVVPRPRNDYNDLALPIKLFDYLSYGRPLLVTDCTEAAAVVRDAAAGIVSADAPDALAAAIRELVGASPEQRAVWGRNAAEAARRNAWSLRAERILQLLGIDAAA